MSHQESKPGWLSVTEALSIAINKPFLAFWRGKIGNELASQIQRESQELGIEVHKMIEGRFDKIKYEGSANAVRMTENFWDKFVIPHKVKAIKLEQSFENEELKLQGTFDAHIETKEGEFIADWKTSNTLDKVSVPLQLSAYAHLSGLGVWRGMAVRIDKGTDTVQVVTYDNLERYWPIFLQCLAVAKYVKWGLTDV